MKGISVRKDIDASVSRAKMRTFPATTCFRRAVVGVVLFFVSSCLVPVQAVKVWPDYFNITVPPNIAPLNFEISECPEKAKVHVVMTGKDGSKLEADGMEIVWNEKKWKSFLSANKGGQYELRLFVKANGAPIVDAVFTNTVSMYPVDSHLTYRLIPPSYTGFSEMGTYLRDLTSFDERPMYRNVQMDVSQCVNCHTFNRANPSNYLFHTRAYKGGTTIVSPKYGKFKVDLKADGLISGGVYPAWHPSGDFVAFSLNETRQSFFAVNPEKIEVMDLQSDLILYSLADGKITVVEDSPENFECFPTWTPDGSALFTVRARTPFKDKGANDAERGERVFQAATNICYDLVVRTFDAKTRKFSAPEIVFDGAEAKKSIIHPRISPDGRWLVATVASHGVFHIWHKDADLVLFDFANRRIRPIAELNSPDTESYHTFSSDGEWMVFSSRRDDAAYTRPYFTKFDKQNGTFSKPFLIPVKRPRDHWRRMKSYNIPEFAAGPVVESPAELRSIVESEPRKAEIEK